MYDSATQFAAGKTNFRPAMTWTDFSSLRWRRADVPASNLGKIAFEQFTKSNDLPCLSVLQTFASADQLSLANLPDHFVLKPASLWSGTGVMLLHRISGLDLWFDAKSGKVTTGAEVIASCKRLEVRLGKPIAFMIEERALDENPANTVPLDYKVFTFHGVTKFVLQVDRNHTPARMAFFDGSFEPILDDRVTISDENAQTRGAHRKPACADALLALARDVTLKLSAAFISVDCYATPNGPVLGELTHTPGGPWFGRMYAFSDQFDAELGAAWRDANTRIGKSEPVVRVPYVIKHGGRVLRTIA